MPILKHKTPCTSCPFRRNSLAGWLGNTTPEQFIDSTHGEIHMPCHASIDYEIDEWEDQLPLAPYCAGSLIHLKNSCKLPVDVNLKEAVNKVDVDRDTVFSFGHEFLEHHS